MPSFPRSTVHETGFNRQAELPYSLRSLDFQAAMQDVYDLFHSGRSVRYCAKRGMASRAMAK